MKQFQTAARRGATSVNNPVDLEFEWEVNEGEYVTMTAHPPTSGQLALFMSNQFTGGSGAIRSMLQFLAWSLSDEDYDIIEGQLADGLDVDVVVEAVRYFISEWSARPTVPSSASTRSRRTTGKSSTAKLPRGASTT